MPSLVELRVDSWQLQVEMSAIKAKSGAPAKIKKLMKRFGTEAGKLNEEDLKELMRSVDRAEPLPRDVRWVMKMADLNGDGNVDGDNEVSVSDSDGMENDDNVLVSGFVRESFSPALSYHF